VHQLLVADRAKNLPEVAARARGPAAGYTIVAASSGSRADHRVTYDVALIDAEQARGFLASLPVNGSTGQLPRVVVLADADDSARAADLVRMGAVGWVYRKESIEVLIETIHAVLRGEVRLPQPLLGELLERAEATADPVVDQAPVEALLTRREIEILRLLERGISRSEIAGYLHLSPNTVRSHVQHILSRLGVHSTLAAVARIRAERIGNPAAMAGASLGRARDERR
jgi:DNA-binding NarL/FixJ family response regulator